MVSKNNRTFENIRPKVHSRDFTVSDMLDRRPPLSLQADLSFDPIRNSLLANTGTLEKLGDPLSQPRLTAGDGNGAFQCDDVRRIGFGVSKLSFLHDHPLYKSTCDYVNKSTCMTTDKATCKVLYMSVPKRKSVQPKLKEQKKPFPVGPDGRTANQRLRQLMDAHPTIRRERDLCRACNELLEMTEDDPDFVRQQSINRILKDQDSLGRSKLVAVIAEAMGVRAFWLQTGRGHQRHLGDELLREYATRLTGRPISK